jgi:hypothetical protein
MATISNSNRRTSVRFALVILSTFAATGSAVATTPGDCVKIQVPDDRLACFDKIFPPEKPLTNPKRDLRDITVDENSRLDKSMRSICSDCIKK